MKKLVFGFLIFVLLISLIFVSGCVHEQECEYDKDCVTNKDFLRGKCVKGECEFAPYSKNENMMVYVSVCNKTGIAYDESQLGIQEIKWEDNILKIKAYVSLYCNEEIEWAKKDLDGEDTLNLIYYSPSCFDQGQCVKCKCAHEIKFHIRDLEQKDYEIILERWKYSYGPVKLPE